MDLVVGKTFKKLSRYRLLTVVFLLLIIQASQSSADSLDDEHRLHQMRLDRRQTSRNVQAFKAEGSAVGQFGLLVIPVDFSDTRLPETWRGQDALASLLFGNDGQTMENYFRVASNAQLELKITLAPLVHLAGGRASYSDIGWHGFHRTRALATEAISAVAELGLEFRRLDMDGPDGIPGSGDDDGQVDGVLILHAGPGQENDTVNGLIQPLQFFIDPPVESSGVEASFYAVASMHSGLGIWAHETGHLLGMEDRYDPLLHPEAGGVDVRSLGGLGRFSLMSSGAWGTGDGWNPALPDAYTCWQLGWTEPVRYPLPGNPACTVGPWRSGQNPPVIAWTSGPLGADFFLMEVRDPQATYPFDDGLPQGQMLVYHVDETVPEGWYSENKGLDYHLRVRLVEADNDTGLQTGEDDGRDEDTFPGPLGVRNLTPLTAPNTDGYSAPSYMSFESITSHGDYVTCRVSDSQTPFPLNLMFAVISAEASHLDIKVENPGATITDLTCTLSISGEGGGVFPGGGTSQQFLLVNHDGTWLPQEPIAFIPPASPAAGSFSNFNFQFQADGQDLSPETRPWIWLSDDSVFDFNHPDWIFWQQDFPNVETNTRWHLWDLGPYLTADQSAVLACTGENHPTSSAWPYVQYGRRGRAAIISPALGEDIQAVQLIHAIEVEYLHAGTVMDGATVFWQGPDGSVVGAVPVDGWDAAISAQSDNSLGGVGAMADSLLVLDNANLPQWRCDVFSVPETGQGPWRLRLEFSSNYLWRMKGWFVASMSPLASIPESAFPIGWSARDEECPAGLLWRPPLPTSSFNSHVVEYFDPVARSFQPIPNQDGYISSCGSEFVMSRDFILEQLRPSGLTRHQLRVKSSGPKGMVASRSIVVYPDDGAQSVGYLEQPFPNPSTGGLKFLVDVPPTQNACLKIYDLRGRLVHYRDCFSGRYQIFWDGFDDEGRRLSSGTYYLKLEGSGFSSMRKVVLIR